MLLGSASLCTRPWTPPQPNRKSLSSSLLCDYKHNHHYSHDAQVNLGQHFHFHHKHNKLKLRSMKKEGGDPAAGGTNSPDDDLQRKKGFWEIDKSKLAKLGLAAVLAYGLIDAVTYTSFFVLAFLGYEKSTGQNPAANLQALLGIVILMWTGNNITRPFRVAGAAVLAPFIDEGLKKVQDRFKFRKLVYAFALVVSMVAAACLVVVGVLVLSRWPKPKIT